MKFLRSSSVIILVFNLACSSRFLVFNSSTCRASLSPSGIEWKRATISIVTPIDTAIIEYMSHLWCLSFSASSGGWEIRYHSAKHPIATKTPPTTSQQIQNTVDESSKKDTTAAAPVLVAKIAE